MRIWGNTKKVLVSWLERIELYIDNKDDIKTFSPILNSLNIIFSILYCSISLWALYSSKLSVELYLLNLVTSAKVYVEVLIRDKHFMISLSKSLSKTSIVLSPYQMKIMENIQKHGGYAFQRITLCSVFLGNILVGIVILCGGFTTEFQPIVEYIVITLTFLFSCIDDVLVSLADIFGARPSNVVEHLLPFC
jgi:hypothetical protein